MKKLFFFNLFLLVTFNLYLFPNRNLRKNGYNNDIFKTNGEKLFIQEHIKTLKSPLVFDVGAHVGTWTSLIKKENQSATIFAFEPNPETYPKLLNTLLRFEKVKTFPFGFSNEKNDSAIFYTYSDIRKRLTVLDGLYNRTVLKKMFHKTPREINVQLQTLDDFCSEHEISKIDFLKIDTEGEEFNVLLGARNILESGIVSMIQFEYGGCFLDANTKLQDIYEMLTPLGYKIHRLIPTGKVEIAEWEPSLECYLHSNYVAIKS